MTAFIQSLVNYFKNRFANEGNGALNTMDSASISMVIQEQLSNVIRKYTSSSCLFSSDLLGYSVADITESIVRNHLLNNTDRELWNRLFNHFIALRRMAFLDSSTISQIFAASLVDKNSSSGVEKAAKFLEKLINLAANQFSDPLAESHSYTETSINKSLQLASSSKLKETSAYQQFIMSSTNNSNKSKKNEFNSDEDENDEIEGLIAPKSIISHNTVSSVKFVNNTSPAKGKKGMTLIRFIWI